MVTFLPRASVLALLLSGLVLAPGCIFFDKVQPEEKKAVAAAKPVLIGPRPSQIGPIWHPSIIEAADPIRGGAMNPGLGGRLLLYGADGLPSYFDGTLTVIAFDVSACSPENPGAQPVFLYRWTWPADVLRQLQREDAVGKGYTLFCPFPPGVFRPDITRVQVQAAFETPGTTLPLYSDPYSLSLGSRVDGVRSQTLGMGQAMTTSNKPK
jgi:hypothetical protein